jgi:hypothetical protein
VSILVISRLAVSAVSSDEKGEIVNEEYALISESGLVFKSSELLWKKWV